MCYWFLQSICYYILVESKIEMADEVMVFCILLKVYKVDSILATPYNHSVSCVCLPIIRSKVIYMVRHKMVETSFFKFCGFITYPTTHINHWFFIHMLFNVLHKDFHISICPNIKLRNLLEILPKLDCCVQTFLALFFGFRKRNLLYHSIEVSSSLQQCLSRST